MTGAEAPTERNDAPERLDTADAVVGDLVARERRSGSPALHAAARERTYSYFDLCNTAAKAGNVLRHVGVRPGDTVAIEPRRDPEVVFTVLGAAQLGATVALDPAVGDRGDARALVIHTERESEMAADGNETPTPPGTSLVVFGGEPTTSGATHWESEVWSENPAAPPAPTTRADPLFRVSEDATFTDGSLLSHAAVLDAAEAVIERASLDRDTTVVVRDGFADPRALVVGVLAPLIVGGRVLLPSDGEDTEEDHGDPDGEDHVVVDPETVTFGQDR
jgi:hypothetical protein